MHVIALVVVLVVALLHIYILIVESFRWGKPAVNKAFGVTPEQAAVMKPMAANMGLYNGFLAAGLIAQDATQRPILTFFLSCVVLAGVVGTLTTGNRRIVALQSAPAAIGLALLWL
jgi:putative membrane protein